MCPLPGIRTGIKNLFCKQEPVFWLVGRTPAKDGGHCSLCEALSLLGCYQWRRKASGEPGRLLNRKGAEDQSRWFQRLKCFFLRGEVLPLPPLHSRGCSSVAEAAVPGSAASLLVGISVLQSLGFKNCFHHPVLVASWWSFLCFVVSRCFFLSSPVLCFLASEFLWSWSHGCCSPWQAWAGPTSSWLPGTPLPFSLLLSPSPSSLPPLLHS